MTDKISVIKIFNGKEQSSEFDLLDAAIGAYIESAKDTGLYLQSIVFCSFYIERLIKQRLSVINPALMFQDINDDVVLYLLDKTNKRRFYHNTVKRPMANSRPYAAKINVLIERLFVFDRRRKFAPSIKRLFQIRDSIVHSDPLKEIEIHDPITNITLAESFKFIESYNIKLPDQVRKIIVQAHDILAADINKKIASAERFYARQSTEESARLVNVPIPLNSGWGEPEREYMFALLCPACYLNSTSLIKKGDPDSEGRPFLNYAHTECRVCHLKLEQQEYEEMAKNFEKYSDRDGDWSVLLTENAADAPYLEAPPYRWS